MQMLSSNIVLGVKAFLSDLKYAHGVLKQEWDVWPCGAPVVYPADDDVNRKITVVSLITPSQSSCGKSESAEVKGGIVAPVDLKPLCGNHKVVPIREFDFGKFPRLREFIRDVGGISLLIEPESGRRRMADVLSNITRSFKLFGMFYFNQWGSKHLEDENDRYVCILTFLDLPYCIPVFNSRKVDGIGLSLSGATINASIKYGRLHRVFRTDFILSNYEDNAFVVDGVTINHDSAGNISILKEINKFSSLDIPIRQVSENKKTSNFATWYKEKSDHMANYLGEPAGSEWNISTDKKKAAWQKVAADAVAEVGPLSSTIDLPSPFEPAELQDEPLAAPEDDSPIVEIIHGHTHVEPPSLVEFDTSPWPEDMVEESDEDLNDLIDEPEEGGS